MSFAAIKISDAGLSCKFGLAARVLLSRGSGVRQVVEEEKLLLARLRQGDCSAFDELARQYGPRLVRLAHRLLGYGRDDEARDAVQEIFARLLARPHVIAASDELEKWLVRVVINQCRTQQRRWTTRLKLLAGWQAKPEASTTEKIDANELVRHAVGKLPARDREVIVLHYLEEMPVGRIGAMLDLPKNVVEVRLHRARKRLKEILEK